MTSSSGSDRAVFAFGTLAVVSAVFSVAVSSIAMGAAFVALAAALLRGGRAAFPRTGLEGAFLLYVAAEALASAFSVDPADSFRNMKRVLLIGIVYVSASAFREERRILVLIGMLAAAGGITALAELFTMRVEGGVIQRPAMFQMAMTEGGIRMLVLLALIPMATARVLPAGGRLALGTALAALLVGLTISQTRGAWLAFLAGLAAVGIFRDRRLLLVLAAVVVLFAVAAPEDFKTRAASVTELSDSTGFAADSVVTNAESNVSRLRMIETGWRMFLDRPLTGWGDIGLRNYYSRYTPPLTEGEGGHLHNNLMEVLVTLGLPGFLAVLWLFWGVLALILRAGAGAPKDSFRGALATGILSAYIGFHVLGLVEYNFGDHEVMVILWAFVGLAAAIAPAGPSGLSGPGDPAERGPR